MSTSVHALSEFAAEISAGRMTHARAQMWLTAWREVEDAMWKYRNERDRARKSLEEAKFVLTEIAELARDPSSIAVPGLQFTLIERLARAFLAAGEGGQDHG